MSAKLFHSSSKSNYFPWFYIFQGCVVAFFLLTLFGPVFPMYMDALGLSKSQIGALLAVPHFLAIFSLLFVGVVARHGPKRIFISISVMRTVFISGLLFLPWLSSLLGPRGVFLAAALMIAAFALCRAIGDTGFFPWEKEMLPDRTRGKVYAVNGIVCGIVAFATSGAAVWTLRGVGGVTGFRTLIALGIVFNIIGLWALSAVRGGRPAPPVVRQAPLAEILAALRNTNFRRYLAGNGIFLMACGVFPFMPLFLREHLG
ncbi:MAG: MFS transporter, partial [Lentisphaerae bacterium]|nr:MFS transporter [Lentisphaerota bacterium]